MAATDTPGRSGGALAALMHAALALPVLALPVRAGAAEVAGEVGFAYLYYRERDLIRVKEPLMWGRVQIGENWTVSASALVDLVSGASPELVSNATGEPVRVITGASILDRRTQGDVKVTRRFGDFAFSASRAVSNEEDYRSRAFGLEATLDLDHKLMTLTAGYGKSNDRIGSDDNPELDERRDTKEYLVGITRVLSPTSIVQSTLQWSRGDGWYNDPYKSTITFVPGEILPIFYPDTRPNRRDSVSWLTRFRHHAPEVGTLQAEYRYYRDNWGIQAHTLDVALQKDLSPEWSLRPALRYYTQSRADFYGQVVPLPVPDTFSSDQRLAAFGGLSPSLRAIWRWEGLTIEGTLGYYYNSESLRAGGGDTGFVPLKAYYGIASVTKSF